MSCHHALHFTPGPHRTIARYFQNGLLADIETKEKFVEDFWEKRDPTFGTPENENKDEYEKRIKERPDGKGWDTDRGRILLQMGFPDERNVRVTTRRGTTWQIRNPSWA